MSLLSGIMSEYAANVPCCAAFSYGLFREYTPPVHRLNSEGVPREHLKLVLRDRRTVNAARKIDRCLLCRRPGVNEAGLCGVCWAALDEEELALAQRWLSGQGP